MSVLSLFIPRLAGHTQLNKKQNANFPNLHDVLRKKKILF